MADSRSGVAVPVKHGKSIVWLDVDPDKGTMTVGEARRALAAMEALGVDGEAERLRLIYGSQQLKDDDASLADVGVVAVPIGTQPRRGAKVLTARGTSRAAVAALSAAAADRGARIVDDLKSAPSAVGRGGAGGAGVGRGGGRRASKSRFGSVRPLPGLPDEDKARALLERLANDPGVVAVMEKHGWHVPVLSELFPHGEVGVSEKCLMGLNKNAGQEILLRIRTDDLEGFRRYDSLLEVMWHELSHNVHSEHDKHFFALMRQLAKEGRELDWTKSGGRTLGGSATRWDPSTVAASDGAQFEGGSHRLGGETEVTAMFSARELAASAAVLRVTAAEAEVASLCGTASADDVIAASEAAASEAAAAAGSEGYVERINGDIDAGEGSSAGEGAPRSATAADSCIDVATDHSDGAEHVSPAEGPTSSAADDVDMGTAQEASVADLARGLAPAGDETASDRHGAAATPGPLKALVDMGFSESDAAAALELYDGDASSAAAHLVSAGMGDAVAGGDPEVMRRHRAHLARRKRIRDATHAFVVAMRVAGHKATTGLDTLARIVRNVVDHPSDEKYRQLRTGNTAFQRRTGGGDATVAAINVLSALGWASVLGSDAPSPTEDLLALAPHADVAVLHAGLEALEAELSSVQRNR